MSDACIMEPEMSVCVVQGGCTDCYNARRRMRARQPRLVGPSPGTCSAVGGLDVGDVNDSDEDVLHKVHVMLHTRMDTIRVQVNTSRRTSSRFSWA